MAQHTHYWSCSKFADWLRGTPKPKAATSKDWSKWRRDAKAAHPIRFWMAEEALGALQDFVTWPERTLHSIKYYCVNRWISRTHSLTAHPNDIKPGTWRDVGNRFLPCLFNELVDFVEIELAWSHIAWASEEDRKKYNAPWNATGWFRTRLWRCPEAGINHLKWAATLTYDDKHGVTQPTTQALDAIEILNLYEWWKNDRPNRPDPYVVSNWSAICERRRERDPDDFMGEDETAEERRETRKALDLMSKLEKKYEAEDERMMIRLIKVRQSLWT